MRNILVFIIILLLNSFFLKGQDQNFKLFKREQIEYYKLYHLNQAQDSILVVSKIHFNESELNSTKLSNFGKIDRIYLKNDSLFFTFKIRDTNDSFDIKTAYFQPGISYRDYYSYRSLPFYLSR